MTNHNSMNPLNIQKNPKKVTLKVTGLLGWLNYR